MVDMESIAAAGLKIGVDPLGGAGVAFWEPIAETYGLNLEIVNPDVDPTFAFYDPGSRWQNPDGLLIALRHGQSDRIERPVRYRLWQRSGLRPAWDRHPQCGADEPQSLPGGGDRLPVPEPPRLAAGMPL